MDINVSNTLTKEFGIIANAVSNEEFCQIVPRNNKFTHVKWSLMFNYFKQQMLDGFMKDMNTLWEDENMPEKLEVLDIQKNKFSNNDSDQTLWRPQLADVNAQLKSHDAAILLEEKKELEAIVNDCEPRISKLKELLNVKRSFIKVLQMDMQKYQKKIEVMTDEIDTKMKIKKNLLLNPPETSVKSEENEFTLKK